jgi:hypothetical protein
MERQRQEAHAGLQPSDRRRPRRFTIDEVIALAAHGVDADLVRTLRDGAFDRLTTDDVITLADHGVEADWLRAAWNAGIRPSVDELVAMADHGVDSEWLAALPAAVITDLEVAELIALADEGVAPEDLRAHLDARAE